MQRIVEGLRLELVPMRKLSWRERQRPMPPRLKSTCAVAIALQRSSTTPSSANISTRYRTLPPRHRNRSQLRTRVLSAWQLLRQSRVERPGPGRRSRKGEDAFRKALALDPRLLEARMHMVFIYLTGGHKQKARTEVDLLRDEYPNDPGVQFVRGVVARLDGDYEKALRSFDRMVRLNPGERVLASYNRARIFMYQQEYEEALRELDQGAALEPEHPLIRFRARVLYYKGEVERPSRFCSKFYSVIRKWMACDRFSQSV